jgi:endonuclease/exonuclease/phosphatase family metal-dependent hydrolase
MFQGIRIINVYATSSAEKRVERECFFNDEVTFLLPTDSTDVIIADHFNCVTSPADCTGRPTTSRTLMTLIKVRGLRDVWETHLHTLEYKHCTNAGASRIDRIYVTNPLKRRKPGVETIAAAFSDHFAVIVLWPWTEHVCYRGLRCGE